MKIHIALKIKEFTAVVTINRLLAIFLFLSMTIGCNRSIGPAGKSVATPIAPSTDRLFTISPKGLAGVRWDIYHPDPQHLWNRLFRRLYERTAQDGKEYGWDALDPLLWIETTHLLEEGTHEPAIRILDEFLSTHGEELISDPLKRAMFQRDMWAVFDWSVYQSMYQTDSYSDQRRALQWRLAQVIQRVALTEEEILSLPDNYGMAVRSQAFPATFQADHPDVAFLPSDLMEPDGEWICLGRDGGPIAMVHTEAFPFFGRSAFLVFIRVPGGREATLGFLRELNSESPPTTLPIDTEVALLRRLLLLDENGNITLSPVVESVQIRHFDPVQNYYEFSINRPLLFNSNSGGFQVNDSESPLFQSHGNDPFEFDHIVEVQIPELCTGCHGGQVYGAQSIISYSRARFPLPDGKRPILSETTPEIEAQTIVAWKLNHQAWKSLEVQLHKEAP